MAADTCEIMSEGFLIKHACVSTMPVAKVLKRLTRWENTASTSDPTITRLDFMCRNKLKRLNVYEKKKGNSLRVFSSYLILGPSTKHAFHGDFNSALLTMETEGSEGMIVSSLIKHQERI